jgi:hypothetical protein
MSIETMKQALEVLEHINQLSIGENAIALPGEIDGAMDSLRAAIEQAEKPVAWRWKALVNGEFVSNWVLTHSEPPPYATESMPLYTAPRQEQPLKIDPADCHIRVGEVSEPISVARQWVGLTDEEIEDEWERVTGHSIFGGNRSDGRTMFLSPDEVVHYTQSIEAKLKEKNAA